MLTVRLKFGQASKNIERLILNKTGFKTVSRLLYELVFKPVFYDCKKKKVETANMTVVENLLCKNIEFKNLFDCLTSS